MTNSKKVGYNFRRIDDVIDDGKCNGQGSVHQQRPVSCSTHLVSDLTGILESWGTMIITMTIIMIWRTHIADVR